MAPQSAVGAFGKEGIVRLHRKPINACLLAKITTQPRSISNGADEGVP